MQVANLRAQFDVAGFLSRILGHLGRLRQASRLFQKLSGGTVRCRGEGIARPREHGADQFRVQILRRSGTTRSP
jgi:hypothetical protein